MKFFQKRGVAITITVLLIAAALLIGHPWTSQSGSAAASASAASASSDYLSYIADDANVLTNANRSKIAGYLEKLDSGYNSIVPLMTVDGLDGEDAADYTEEVWNDSDFLTSDMLLLVDVESGDWYLYPGSEISPYLDASLETLCKEHLNSADFTDGGKWAADLYKDLLSWYAKSIPAADSGSDVQPEYTADDRYARSDRRSIFETLLGLVILIFFIKLIVSLVRRPRYSGDADYRGGSSGGGFWKGLFWGSVLSGNRRRRWDAPPPPGPRPGPRPGGPRPGGAPRPSSGPRPSSRPSGSRSGFSGGSRGGFSGGSRGGFGGSRGGGSRGGFGGGRK